MYSRFGKRALDVFVALLLCLLFLPCLLLIFIGTKFTDNGPIFFSQKRVGKGGGIFNFYKFRTMPVNTGDIPSDQLADLKLPAFFQFLRRSNIDEIPQLFNILRGDMSLIGPRPCLASQVCLIDLRRQNSAFNCAPGLTGLAQVNSFDGMSVEQKAEFDGEYARNISLLKDVRIFTRTFSYLLKPPPKY